MYGKYKNMPDPEMMSAALVIVPEMVILALVLLQSGGGTVFYRITTRQTVDGTVHVYYHTETMVIMRTLVIGAAVLWAITLLLCLISRQLHLGLAKIFIPVNILAFSGILAQGWLDPADLSDYLIKMLLGSVVCVLFVFLVHVPVNQGIFCCICRILAAAGVLLMIWGVFNQVNGNGSWLLNGSFQIGEVFKLAILLLSVVGMDLICRDKKSRRLFYIASLLMLLNLFVVKDLGNFLVLAVLLLVVIVKFGLLQTGLKLLAAGCAAAPVVFLLFRNKIMQRFSNALFYPVTHYLADSSTNENLRQAILSLVRGGILGTGVSASSALYASNISSSETDFVFMASTSIFGLGYAVIVLGSMLVLTKNVSPSQKETMADHHDAYQGSVICAFLLIQCFVHVAASASLIPMTGVTFPLLSRGGSSMLVCFAAIGSLAGLQLPKAKQKAIKAWYGRVFGISAGADVVRGMNSERNSRVRKSVIGRRSDRVRVKKGCDVL